MSAKTHSSIAAYIISALVILSALAAPMVVHHYNSGDGMFWERTGDVVRLKNIGAVDSGVRFLMDRDNLSQDAATRLAYQHQRETNTRLAEEMELPLGSIIDYYDVDGTGAKEQAEYLGSAQVVAADSEIGKAFAAAAHLHAQEERVPSLLEKINETTKKGFLLVPLSWMGIDLAKTPAQAVMNAGSGQVATPVRVGVIAARFPGFYDVSPRSNGDINANDAVTVYVDYSTGQAQPSSIPEAVYRQDPQMPGMPQRWNFATTSDNPPGTDLPFPNSFFDSPGGVFHTSSGTYGVPRGTPNQWQLFFPPANPSQYLNDQALRDGMFELLHNQDANSTSASNFFYQQTQGRYRLYGDRNDVMGWLFSAHQLNRYEYHTGGGNELFIFPGTPLIRPVPVSDGDFNPAVQQVVRATLSPRGLTILFSRDRPSLSLSQITINAYTTADTDVEQAGTQPGTVEIRWDQTTGVTPVMDPYDSRRWTIPNPGGNTWRFQTYHSNPANRTFVPFVSPDGGTWSLTVTGAANLANYKNNQRRGCPRLSNTRVTNADVRVAYGGNSTPLNRRGNRLKSLYYYTHAFIPNVSSQAYQIVHMQNEYGFDDDISGTAVPTTRNVMNPDAGYRDVRPAPWDMTYPAPWNGGYWATANEENAGNHRTSALRNDVAQVMADQGLSMAGYNVIVHVTAVDSVGSRVQPESNLDMNETDGPLVYFHELAHAVAGTVDLYDNDFYLNMGSVPRPIPPFNECPAMDPYSVMAMINGRLDEYHQHIKNWTETTIVTRDVQTVEIPALEGLLRDPVLLKLPANPYYLKEGIPDANWREYFLVSNRHHTRTGAYSRDSSSRGLYIYHIDTRGAARSNPALGGWQRDDQLLSVIIEQSDGNYDLQFRPKGYWSATDLISHPFGADTAGGATGVDRFWQFPMFAGNVNNRGFTVQNVNAAGSPTSKSYGYTYLEQSGGQNVLIPGTETDSFVRILNISERAPIMTADVYVEPAEVVVTGESLIAPGQTVQQGQQNVGVLKLTLENPDGTINPADFSKMSTKDVYIDSLRILESGTSSGGVNVSAVKLYVDANNNGIFEPGAGDTLLAQTTVQSAGQWADHAVFDNLGYNVPLGDQRVLFVAYDVSPTAQTSPRITVGAEFTDSRKIMPRVPGAVQERVRNAAKYSFGTTRFPIGSRTAPIVNFPDRLVITPTNLAPAMASQGQNEVAMLQLRCEVNPNQDPRPTGIVRLDRIIVDQIGSIDGVSGLVNCVLYDDVNKNGIIEPTDVKLGEVSFTPQAGTRGRATFTNLNFPINSGPAVAKNLILAVGLSSDADTTENIQISLEFPTPGPPPAQSHVRLINNVNELDANKDFVEWDADKGAVWPMRSNTVIITEPNNPPNPPTSGFTPTGGVQISDQTPTLRWDDASDPDPEDTPDTLRYEVEIATDAAFSSIVVTGSTAPGVTEFTVPEVDSLDLNAMYYWRVRTVDSKGARSVASAVQNFELVANRPPAPVPALISPIGGVNISNPRPFLLWEETTDPDTNDTPDTLVYDVEVDNNADFSSPEFVATTDPGVTTIQVGVTLNVGGRYHWRVRARDRYGAESPWSVVEVFNIVQNEAPFRPQAAFTPAGGEIISTENPTLTWGMPNPPDPNPSDTIDTISYGVQISTSPDMSSGPYFYQRVTAIGEQFITVLDRDLADNTQYWWRVRAIDGGGMRSDWSPVQNFWVNLVNQPPNEPDSGFRPYNGQVVSTTTPSIQWNPATDPDPSDTADTLYYVLELSSDNFATVSHQYTSAVGNAFVNVTTPLTDLTRWYYRVKTVDSAGAESPWSDIQFFNIDIGRTAPYFTDPQVVPLYGDITMRFELFVTYVDADNDPPGVVRCSFNNGSIVRTMSKLNPTDNDATDGIVYVVGIDGNVLGLGANWHVFTSESGARWPEEVGEEEFGPVIGTPSTTTFTLANGTPTDVYEENGTIYVRVEDLDKDIDPNVRDTVQVTVTEEGGDSETVTLLETGVSTGIFFGSIPSIGAPGDVDDGVLNAIGGPDGNQLLVEYLDPNDILNPNPDYSSDTAMLFDTTPPARIDPGVTVVSGPHGRSAVLDWSHYDEAAQIDVEGYYIYMRNAQFGSVANRTPLPLPEIGAGTQTYTVEDLEPNREYWFAVVAYDEVPLQNNNVISTSVMTRDTTAPAINSQVPAPNATEVALDTNITFRLQDPGVGIDLQENPLQIIVTQNGEPVAFTQSIQGDDFDMTVTVIPDANFDWNAQVIVNVEAVDRSGNTLQAEWTFALRTDNELPTIENLSPAPEAENVPVNSTISFRAKDPVSGINPASIRVELDGVPVDGEELTISGTANDTLVTYRPADGLNYSSTHTVEVWASDNAGNTATAKWDFDTVADSNAVSIDQFNPARDATGVPIDTTISMRLNDPLSGIRIDSLRVWVNNVEVTDDLVTQGTSTTLLVTYTPPEPFEYSSDVFVRVYVEDNVGNETEITYKFTTSEAPTYSISGVITDTANNPLAGVKVTAGDQEALTDGTGFYRLTGLLAGTYTVQPELTEYVFTPDVHDDVTVPDDQTDKDFIGRLLTYTISGRITEGDAGVAGVQVQVGDRTVTTDANGRYVVPDVPNGRYTVTPTLTNYQFNPSSKPVDVAGADKPNVDFTAVADTYSVSGTITDSSGNRVQGARVSDGTNEAVTNAAGQYVLSGLRAGTYTLTASKPGYSMLPTSQEVTVPPGQTEIDYVAYMEMSNTFPVGINMIGVPGQPVEDGPLSVFGTGQVFRWNPGVNPPAYENAQRSPNSEHMRVRAGRGFFVRFGEQTTLRVAGVPTSTARSYNIGLSEGWNMIANPMPGTTSFANFVPSQNGGIAPFAFVYNPATGSYELITAARAIAAVRTSLLAWEGAWVRAMTGGVSLAVSAGAQAASAEEMQPQAADLNGGWIISVVARAGDRADYSSVAGTVPGSNGQYNIDNPPTAPNTVDVYFVDTAGRRLAHEVRSQAGPQSFQFVVSCSVPDVDVNIALPDLSSVPADMQVTLVDEDAGTSIYARTMSGYTYRSAGAQSTRNFRLVVSPRDVGSLAITMSTASARSGSMVMTYSISKNARVTARVLNIAGRPVRTLCADRMTTAGVQTLNWELNNDAGARVPAGMYLLQVEAVAENGQQARAITQLNVGR